MPDPILRSDIKLSFPYDTPTTEITLTAPDFGNIERLGFTRINRKTRGGKMIVFFDPIWPTEDILVFQITGLSQSQKDAVENFLEESIGQFIRLRDHESFVWKGIILNPNGKFTALREVCNRTEEEYGWGFEFQGEFIEVEEA